MRKLVISTLILMFAGVANAGTFDCSVIYDEFDSLMFKNFLIQPASYVRVNKDRISRIDYNTNQKGKLLLKASHQGWGVAVIHTNRNTWGKFLYTWGAPMQNGYPSLVIKELTLFGRVMDGDAPRTTSLINVPTSWTVDLDTAALANNSTADIWYHNVDGKTMYLEAVNGAELSLPMESMCK